MNWMTILAQLFEIVIFPLLAVGTIYLINLIKVKIQELKQKKNDDLYRKYLDMLEDVVIQCVLATTQTYVDSLKKEGAFDADAQKVAFTKTYTNVMKILSAEAKEYLTEALGDLEVYIYNRIEANVKLTK
jgi:hypothetical protein